VSVTVVTFDLFSTGWIATLTSDTFLLYRSLSHQVYGSVNSVHHFSLPGGVTHGTVIPVSRSSSRKKLCLHKVQLRTSRFWSSVVVITGILAIGYRNGLDYFCLQDCHGIWLAFQVIVVSPTGYWDLVNVQSPSLSHTGWDYDPSSYP